MDKAKSIDDQLADLKQREADLRAAQHALWAERRRAEKAARRSHLEPVDFINCIGQRLSPGMRVVAITHPNRKPKPVVGTFVGVNVRKGVNSSLKVEVMKKTTIWKNFDTGKSGKYRYQVQGITPKDSIDQMVVLKKGTVSIGLDRVFAIL